MSEADQGCVYSDRPSLQCGKLVAECILARLFGCFLPQLVQSNLEHWGQPPAEQTGAGCGEDVSGTGSAVPTGGHQDCRPKEALLGTAVTS